MENPIGTGPIRIPGCCTLCGRVTADLPEEFEKYLLQLQLQVLMCLSLSPSKTFSIDIETCYPVDTVHNSP